MKHTTRLRHRKRLRKRYQSYRRMEFYDDNLTHDMPVEHVGACCHLPKEYKKA